MMNLDYDMSRCGCQPSQSTPKMSASTIEGFYWIRCEHCRVNSGMHATILDCVNAWNISHYNMYLKPIKLEHRQ